MKHIITLYNQQNKHALLTKDMVQVSEEGKYTLALDKGNISWITIWIPVAKDKDVRGRSLEERLAQLLFSTAEIRAKQVAVFCDMQKTGGIIDLNILSALLSKLRGCTHLRILNIEGVTSSERYSEALSKSKEQILDPSLDKLNILFDGKTSIDSIRVINKKCFKGKGGE